MGNQTKTPNRLINEASPYLLQHVNNPVNWYPWGDEAFEAAREEDKPIFLSIGYSTCHWCHVMAHESFENDIVAKILNRDFISIKVDKEERPDIDTVYMRVCQALTGSGGWPTSIFMSADGKPFFAGTYYPKDYFIQLLEAIGKAWKDDRYSLQHDGDEIVKAISSLDREFEEGSGAPIDEAVKMFRDSFDSKNGGFGRAPKFPSPHNLMFLLRTAPELAEKTLQQMYRGGLFDHIGGGFSRYSTDNRFLVPHFEKMLYDNALLAIAYLMAYEKTENELYKTVAERVFNYLERELLSPEGGFYSAQDADSEGEEGKYYVFTPSEIITLLGKEDGERFCRYYGITPEGNFEGKSIPNLLHAPERDEYVESLLPKVYEYRKSRNSLHTDKKILTSWNCLAAAAYAMARRIVGDKRYLSVAIKAINYINRNLIDNYTVYVGITGDRLSEPGFLDDYAFYVLALIELYQSTMDESYLTRAKRLAIKTVELFLDGEYGGFFFSGKNNEKLITRPKETYDGAIPSGNSVMAYNFKRLYALTGEERFEILGERQNAFMNGASMNYPAGYGFYLYSALPVKTVVCAPKDLDDLKSFKVKTDWIFRITDSPAYPLINDKMTFYVCEEGVCRPPSNEI